MADVRLGGGFTDEEKALIRFYLAYPNLSQVQQAMQLGIPAAQQALFLLEGNFDRILPAGENIVRKILCQLNDIVFGQLTTARSRMRAIAIGEIKLNADEAGMLTGEFIRWQRLLADQMASPINPYGEVASFGIGGAMGGGVNVPVITS